MKVIIMISLILSAVQAQSLNGLKLRPIAYELDMDKSIPVQDRAEVCNSPTRDDIRCSIDLSYMFFSEYIYQRPYRYLFNLITQANHFSLQDFDRLYQDLELSRQRMDYYRGFMHKIIRGKSLLESRFYSHCIGSRDFMSFEDDKYCKSYTREKLTQFSSDFYKPRDKNILNPAIQVIKNKDQHNFSCFVYCGGAIQDTLYYKPVIASGHGAAEALKNTLMACDIYRKAEKFYGDLDQSPYVFIETNQEGRRINLVHPSVNNACDRI